MHHAKALDAFGRLSHRIHGASGRYFGSIQLVWCARPPVLNYQIEPPGRANAHDTSADKHCVFDMHHAKALDAFGRLSHRIHGAWGRYFDFCDSIHAPPIDSALFLNTFCNQTMVRCQYGRSRALVCNANKVAVTQRVSVVIFELRAVRFL